MKENEIRSFSMEGHKVESFVLAHCFDAPVFDDDVEGWDVLKGEGVNGDEFERLLADLEFTLWVREWCSKEKCNQVVVSKEGYPSGCRELVEMEVTDRGAVGQMVEALRKERKEMYK